MVNAIQSLADRLSARRKLLGMTHSALAARSGVSEPTVKRVLGGRAGEASLAAVEAIAGALGIGVTIDESDAESFKRRAAMAKAERIARLVQATSALEGQAVDDDAFQRLVERSFYELMSGPSRRIWSD